MPTLNPVGDTTGYTSLLVQPLVLSKFPQFKLSSLWTSSLYARCPLGSTQPTAIPSWRLGGKLVLANTYNVVHNAGKIQNMDSFVSIFSCTFRASHQNVWDLFLDLLFILNLVSFYKLKQDYLLQESFRLLFVYLWFNHRLGRSVCIFLICLYNQSEETCRYTFLETLLSIRLALGQLLCPAPCLRRSWTTSSTTARRCSRRSSS